jgi:hypothetical protein
MTMSDKDTNEIAAALAAYDEIAAALAAYAKQLQIEADMFRRWADEQRKLGRPEAEVIYGNYVRETGPSASAAEAE